MGELQFPRSSSLCSPRRENQRFSPSWCLRTLAPAKLVKIVGSYTIGNFQRDAVSLLLWRWSVSGRSARIALERRNPSWPAPRRDDKSLRVPDASTLEAGPERSIVHRSLKPLNIMVIVARLRGSLPSADHTVPNRDEHLIVFPEHGLLVNRQKSPGQKSACESQGFSGSRDLGAQAAARDRTAGRQADGAVPASGERVSDTIGKRGPQDRTGRR